MIKQKFLGAGIKFPMQVNPATGRVVLSAEAESIKESLYLILMTQKTERFARGEFGSNIMSYTFMDMNNTWITMMSRDIHEDIVSQEPRIADVDIRIEPRENEGCLIVNIEYRIITDNVNDNMVFPFYLKGADKD